MLGYDSLPDILTAKEVQEYLRLGRTAVYSLLQNGTIRSIRVGQKFLVPKAALRELLGDGAKEPDAGIPVKG